MRRIGKITVEYRFADSEDTPPIAVGLQELAHEDVERGAPIGFQGR